MKNKLISLLTWFLRKLDYENPLAQKCRTLLAEGLVLNQKIQSLSEQLVAEQMAHARAAHASGELISQLTFQRAAVQPRLDHDAQKIETLTQQIQQLQESLRQLRGDLYAEECAHIEDASSHAAARSLESTLFQETEDRWKHELYVASETIKAQKHSFGLLEGAVAALTNDRDVLRQQISAITPPCRIQPRRICQRPAILGPCQRTCSCRRGELRRRNQRRIQEASGVRRSLEGISWRYSSSFGAGD